MTDQDQSLYVDGVEALKKRLFSVCPRLGDPSLDSRLQEIIANWRRVSNRLYGHYQVSAEAYFKYLRLISPGSGEGGGGGGAPLKGVSVNGLMVTSWKALVRITGKTNLFPFSFGF